MAFPVSLPRDIPLATVTQPAKTLWVIELHNGSDNRLTHDLIGKAFLPALDEVERCWRRQWREAQRAEGEDGGRGAVIIVGNRKQDKFFGNGLDFASALKDPLFFVKLFDPMIHRLLTFPIPTIAALNGHTFAGSFALALACDYRVMTDGCARNAWLCMNEVHIGGTLSFQFGTLVKAKVTDAQTARKVVLEGHRFTPPEALACGLVDHLVQGDTEAVLQKAREVASAVSVHAQAGAWGLIRSHVYGESVQAFGRSSEYPVKTVALDDMVAKSRL
ncbi:ClpP/crotonase-like domain-containing protein [Phanerochaete sordida]|uniref:ClpP/crotonase-like domain-containing protein n=1 Tax=Phanerochaete sordida TaxID=48140 RepID=A0A9P3GG13_9APHY|nr:ClpP/crotonase-like domain-containing protein [Phanerochaete sordida]